MSKKNGRSHEQPPMKAAEIVTTNPDPLHCTIGPQHLVAVLQQRYPTIYDACMGFAAAAAQEARAREVLAERDARIAELEGVKEAERIVSPNGVAG